MPRANRIFLPGYAWHITHRCHQREFLLKFGEDRRRWRHWLFEATKRYGLRVLNYIATSNHVHLLVLDRGEGEIAQSMQLIAGRTAQDYNRRKARKGAYWEDRYHATAIDTDSYLAHCMRYIDLNMVRAGAVSEPMEWDVSGLREIQEPLQRYRIIDQGALLELFGVDEFSEVQRLQQSWIDDALKTETNEREEKWSRALAVGSHSFIERFRAEGGVRLLHRKVESDEFGWQLREESAEYNSVPETASLSVENVVYFEPFTE